ncbi:MAG: 3-phosphoshikimate 1-carboxyvinyltransferase [Rikenellaceae bacterium]
MDMKVVRSAVNGSITPPSSKSYAQRALAIALLSQGESTITNIEMCNDTLAAMSCIEALGAKVTKIDETTLKVEGGMSANGGVLNIGESGLSSRIFTPLASLSSSAITIEGHGSILTRPMDLMLNPLKELGVKIESNNGYLPITVSGPIEGGEVNVDGSLSSQFLTGLLIALPSANKDTTIHVDRAVSKPYIDMTIDCLQSFGVEVKHTAYQEFEVKAPQQYRATSYQVEGDWSAASTLLVAGAIAGSVRLENLSRSSKQADVAICDAIISAGAHLQERDGGIEVSKSSLKGFSFDATQCPDLFPALVALAAACQGESRISGAERLVHKESHRGLTLQAEYAKLGIEIGFEGEDIMVVKGGEMSGGRVYSHNDHRIAMSLAVAALIAKEDIIIEGAECVAKSYPNFYDDLFSIMK